MEPNHPFLLPRTVPTSAAVMFHKPQRTIVSNLTDNPHGYLIVKSNVEEMLTVCTEKSPPSPLTGGYFTPGYDVGLSEPIFPATTITCGGSYIGPDGFVQEPTVGTKPGWVMIEPDGSLRKNRAYQWRFSTTGSAGAQVAVECPQYNLTGAPVTVRNLAGGALVSGTFAKSGTGYVATLALTDAPLNTYTIDFVASGVVQTQIVFNGTVTWGERPKIEVYSLWDLLGEVDGALTSQEQFIGAEKYSITGLSALISNTTAAQYKSGSLVCAQMPGGSSHVIPQLPKDVYEVIASYNDPKTYSGQLNKGAHWFFSPEKIQDWFFRPTTDPDGDRPYFVMAWSGVAVNDLANNLGLTVQLRANIELLTADISLMKFLPTADLGRLMDLYVTMVAAHNTLSENPGHMKKVGTIIKSVLKSPYTRDALLGMAKAGTKLIPLALAAL